MYLWHISVHVIVVTPWICNLCTMDNHCVNVILCLLQHIHRASQDKEKIDAVLKEKSQ